MRKFILFLLVFFSLNLSAEGEFWVMKTQNGRIIKMSDVSYIMESDGASVFSIVCKDNSLVSDVTSVTFSKTADTGINDIPHVSSPAIARVSGNYLVIIGLSTTTAAVYNLSGSQLLSTRISGKGTKIDISILSGGIYILRAGGTSVKFIKK